MAKYRARHCPNCNYYLGFSITKPPAKSKETIVTSFCLNCNYKLPINKIVRGTRRTSPPFRRTALRLVSSAKLEPVTQSKHPRDLDEPDKPLALLDYTRHLRVIGQDLESLRIKSFNLECTGDAYLVWPSSGSVNNEEYPLSRLSKNRLRKLWKNKSQLRAHGNEERLSLPSFLPMKRYRYSLRDIEIMEYENRRRRHRKNTVTDGHSLSQLLRTVGAIVGQRRERLLGISWQDFSISVVVETTLGQRRIDVFRPDNLYDLWVRMYLRRDNRALSDFPR